MPMGEDTEVVDMIKADEVEVEAVIVMADKHPMDQVPGRYWLLGYPL